MIKQLLHIFAIAFIATQAFKDCEGKILQVPTTTPEPTKEETTSPPEPTTTEPTTPSPTTPTTTPEATTPGTTVSPGGGCRDLTLDACEGEKPFNTLKDVGKDYCQKICKEVYSDRCTFFIYDGLNELCELYDYAEENYAASCKRIAGRPTPTLEECQNSPDPCVVRTLIIYWPFYLL